MSLRRMIRFRYDKLLAQRLEALAFAKPLAVDRRINIGFLCGMLLELADKSFTASQRILCLAGVVERFGDSLDDYENGEVELETEPEVAFASLPLALALFGNLRPVTLEGEPGSTLLACTWLLDSLISPPAHPPIIEDDALDFGSCHLDDIKAWVFAMNEATGKAVGGLPQPESALDPSLTATVENRVHGFLRGFPVKDEAAYGAYVAALARALLEFTELSIAFWCSVTSFVLPSGTGAFHGLERGYEIALKSASNRQRLASLAINTRRLLLFGLDRPKPESGFDAMVDQWADYDFSWRARHG